jgi:hypothetical protein
MFAPVNRPFIDISILTQRRSAKPSLGVVRAQPRAHEQEGIEVEPAEFHTRGVVYRQVGDLKW